MHQPHTEEDPDPEPTRRSYGSVIKKSQLKLALENRHFSKDAQTPVSTRKDVRRRSASGKRKSKPQHRHHPTRKLAALRWPREGEDAGNPRLVPCRWGYQMVCSLRTRKSDGSPESDTGRGEPLAPGDHTQQS